jgi:lysophospholipase L1-like esterase
MRTTLLFTVFALFLACVTADAQTKKTKKRMTTSTYLALGDSYTIGELVAMHDNFPHQTAAILNNEKIPTTEPVIVATTGWTTDELAAAISERNITGTYSFVSLLIGVNNQYRGRSIDNYRIEFEQLLKQSIAFAGGKVHRVFVLSIPDWGATPFAEGKDRAQIAKAIDDYNATCREITLAHGCHYLEITESTRHNASVAGFLAEDGLHPSGKEYAVWAQRLAAAVRQQFNSELK